MKTKDLIEKLQTVDPELDVYVCVRYKNGDHSHMEVFEDIDLGIVSIYRTKSDNETGTPIATSLSVYMDNENILSFYSAYEIAEFGEQDEEE